MSNQPKMSRPGPPVEDLSYTVYHTEYRIRRRLNIAVELLAQIVYHFTRSHLIITSRLPESADITQIVRRILRPLRILKHDTDN